MNRRGRITRPTPGETLDALQIRRPCPVEWASMNQVVKGDDRARFCGQCKQTVFNVSAMTRAEAKALVTKTKGAVCVQLFRRQDGKVMTRDCSPTTARTDYQMPELRGRVEIPYSRALKKPLHEEEDE